MSDVWDRIPGLISTFSCKEMGKIVASSDWEGSFSFSVSSMRSDEICDIYA